MTKDQKERLVRDWRQVTKTDFNPEQIREIRAAIYFFGSELECLRIRNYYHYSDPELVKVQYDDHSKTWSFRLEFAF